MDDFILARVLNGLAVVMWIGATAFVAIMLVPTMPRHVLPMKRLREFLQGDRRFAPQTNATAGSLKCCPMRASPARRLVSLRQSASRREPSVRL